MSSTQPEKVKPENPPREVEIIVNGREVPIGHKETLTFDEVAALSGLPTGSDVAFTITYRRGNGEKPEGSMVEGGDPVRVKDGMIFSVSSTNRS